MRRTTIRLAMAASAIAGLATFAVAQGFPDRPINLIVGFPPGGSTDVGARVIAAIAEKDVKQPIVVVNKAGAGGQISWTELARAKPDGYTIGFLNLPATNTTILDPERKAIFKPDSRFKTFKDLLDEAKSKPGTLRAATTGILSDDHLAILMTEEAAPGTNFRIVHLDGGATQFKEVLAGNVDVAFDNVGSIVKQVQAGQVRALVVTDTVRSKFLPDVPSTTELGFKTIISSSTRGIAAPKGTPPEVVAKLTAMLKKAIEDPDHVAKLEAQGLAIKMMVGAEYLAYYNETHERAKKYTEWARTRPQK